MSAFYRLTLDDLFFGKARMQEHDVGLQALAAECFLNPGNKVAINVWLSNDLDIWYIGAISPWQLGFLLATRASIGARASTAIRALVVTTISRGPRTSAAVETPIASIVVISTLVVAPSG